MKKKSNLATVAKLSYSYLNPRTKNRYKGFTFAEYEGELDATTQASIKLIVGAKVKRMYPYAQNIKIKFL